MTSFPTSEFDRLLQSFKAIGQCKSELQRQFWLYKVAPYHGLSRAECRRLFSVWQIEQVEGGSDA